MTPTTIGTNQDNLEAQGEVVTDNENAFGSVNNEEEHEDLGNISEGNTHSKTGTNQVSGFEVRLGREAWVQN